MGSIGQAGCRVNRYMEENERKLTIKRRLIYDGLSLAWMNEWKGSRSALSAEEGGEGKNARINRTLFYSHSANFLNVIHHETTVIII